MAETTTLTDEDLLKKKAELQQHLPFITKMLEKVKGTDFEKKWQQMYNCITNDKKKLNLSQIEKMDATIIGLKKQLGDPELPKPFEGAEEKKPQIDSLTNVDTTVSEPAKTVSTENSQSKEKLNSSDAPMPEERLAYKYNIKKKTKESEGEVSSTSNDMLRQNSYLPRTSSSFDSDFAMASKPSSLLSPEIRDPRLDFNRSDPRFEPYDRRDSAGDSRFDSHRDPRLESTSRDHYNDSRVSFRPSIRDPRLQANIPRVTNYSREDNNFRPSVPNRNSYGSNDKYDDRFQSERPIVDRRPYGGGSFNRDREYYRNNDPRIEKPFNRNDYNDRSQSYFNDKTRTPTPDRPSNKSYSNEDRVSPTTANKEVSAGDKSNSFKIPKVNNANDTNKTKAQNDEEPRVKEKKKGQETENESNKVAKKKKKLDNDKSDEPVAGSSGIKIKKSRIRLRLPSSSGSDSETPLDKRQSVGNKDTEKKKKNRKKKVKKVEEEVGKGKNATKKSTGAKHNEAGSSENGDGSKSSIKSAIDDIYTQLANTKDNPNVLKILDILKTMVKDEPAKEETAKSNEPSPSASGEKSERDPAASVEKEENLKSVVPVPAATVVKPAPKKRGPRKKPAAAATNNSNDATPTLPTTAGKNKRGNRELAALNEDIDNMFIRDSLLQLTEKRACTLAPKVIEEPIASQESENLVSPIKVVKTKSPVAKKKRKTSLETLKKKLTKPCHVRLSKDEVSDYLSQLLISEDEVTDDADSIDFVPTRRQFAVKRGSTHTLLQAMDASKNFESAESIVGPLTPLANIGKYLISDSQIVDLADDEMTSRNKRKSVDTDLLDKIDLKRLKTIDVKIVKNTNINVHPTSQFHCKSCELCNYKQSNQFDKMVAHYKTMHPETEVLLSRLSPLAASKVLKNPFLIKGEKSDKNEIMTDCLFCEEGRAMSMAFWKYHIASHTGEFMYKCMECGVEVLMKSSAHNNRQSIKCTSTNFEIVRNFDFTDNHLYAYMCDTCHYVQLDRSNLESHLCGEHLDNPSVRIIKFSILNYRIIEPVPIKSEIFTINPVQDLSDIDIIETVEEEDEWEDVEDEDTDNEANSKRSGKKNFKAEVATTPVGHISVSDIVSLEHVNVQNIGLALCTDGILFICEVSDCKFKAFERDDFILHLVRSHQSVKWNGYCNKCLKKVSNHTSLLDEFEHLKCHVKMVQQKAVENSKLLTVGSTPEIPQRLNDSSVPKKIPTVPSSIPSATTTTQPPAVELKTPVITSVKSLLQFGDIQHVNAKVVSKIREMTPMIQIPKAPLFDPLVSLEQLRPWLKESDKLVKTFDNCEELKKDIGLFALFKCMGTRCTYFTADKNIFLQHLTCHEKTCPEDSNQFCACSYCSYVGSDMNDLADHVIEAHKHDTFQCGYCFYRSCVDINVVTHQDEHHNIKPKKVLDCELIKIDERNISETVRLIRKSVVPAMICVFCRSKFFEFEEFKNHLEGHEENAVTKCVKCKGKVAKMELPHHLQVCHGFGKFQCCYCKYGTDSLNLMKRHLANIHPSQMTFITERSKSLVVASTETGVDALRLIKVMDKTTSNQLRKCYFSQQEMLNIQSCLSINNLAPDDLIENKSVVTPPSKAALKLVKLLPGMNIQQTAPQINAVKSNQSIIIGKPNPGQVIQMSPSKNVSMNAKGNCVLRMANGSVLNIKKICTIPANQPRLPQQAQPPQVNQPNADSLMKISSIFSLKSEAPHPSPAQQQLPVVQTDVVKHQIKLTPEQLSTFNQREVDNIISKMQSDAGGIDFDLLYRCCVLPCEQNFDSPQSLLHHLKSHKLAPHYECLYCSKKFSCPINFKNHLVEHSLKRFFCFYCYHKEGNRCKLDDHISQVHKIYDSLCLPTNSSKNDLARDTFVVCPLGVTAEQYIKFLKKFIDMEIYQNTVNSHKTHFNLDEIDLIPTTAIFPNALFCGLCDFSSNVRTNFLRHFRKHKPIGVEANPSCPATPEEKSDVEIIDLDEMEKESSDVAKSSRDIPINNWPKFVPLSKRYVCGFSNCAFLKFDDELFKTHLLTCHSTVENYKCPHCSTTLCGEKLNVDAIAHHIKLHGERLLKCSVCCQIHHDYNILKLHVSSHLFKDPTATVVTLRNFSNEYSSPKKVDQTTGPKFDYFCEFCTFHVACKSDMINHVGAEHQIKFQFKCSHCEVTSNSVKGFEIHFKNFHPAVENLKVLYTYSQRNLKNFNIHDSDLPLASISTQPLWRRNMLTLKHIRGILFEPENGGKGKARQKPTVSKTENDSIKVDAKKEVGQQSKTKFAFKNTIFSCAFCSKFFGDMESVIRHWNIRHKNPLLTSSSVTHPGKPFRFFVQKIIKCHYCDFSSYLNDTKNHILLSHLNKRLVLTDAENKLKCGLCDFIETENSTLEDHFFTKHPVDELNNDKSKGPRDIVTDFLIDYIIQATNLLYTCKHCTDFKTCILPDIENHLTKIHETTISENNYEKQKIDLTSQILQTMTFECKHEISCNKIFKDLGEFANHLYMHLSSQFFNCILCKNCGGNFDFLLVHYKVSHNKYYKKIQDKTTQFKYRKLDIMKELVKHQMIFVNGLTITLGDAANTSYSPINQILTIFNDKNYQLLKEFKAKNESIVVKALTVDFHRIDAERDFEETRDFLASNDKWMSSLLRDDATIKDRENIRKSEQIKEERKLKLEKELVQNAEKIEKEIQNAEKETKNIFLETNSELDDSDSDEMTELVIVETESVDSGGEEFDNLESDPLAETTTNSKSKLKDLLLSYNAKETIENIDQNSSESGTSVLRDLLLQKDSPESGDSDVIELDDEDMEDVIVIDCLD